jgi:hypothetical protein
LFVGKISHLTLRQAGLARFILQTGEILQEEEIWDSGCGRLDGS